MVAGYPPESSHKVSVNPGLQLIEHFSLLYTIKVQVAVQKMYNYE